jgi:hypothetical protein
MAAPLPAGTIAKLVNTNASIKSVTQPYATFGGQPAETADAFRLRVSERLRHKDRPITVWDYERLVLQAFPSIHRVKCLNATSYTNSGLNEIAPGHVTVVTIPDMTNLTYVNPLRPYTFADTLAQINIFLLARLSCHIQLHVNNPRFEEIRLDFKLQLQPGLIDFKYYSTLLQNAITAFLSPWAYGQPSDIQFGGTVEKSILVNFIQEQTYVAFITDVKMYQRIDPDEGGTESGDQEEITASTDISILVSAPAASHAINPYTAPAASGGSTPCVDPNIKPVPKNAPKKNAR